MPNRPRMCLLDACSLLNIYASGYINEILDTLPFTCAVVVAVERETLYIRRGGSGEDADEKVTVDMSPLIAANRLKVVSPNNDEEENAYVAYATQLHDGEAMTCALASLRGFDIVTDDRKASRVLETHAPHVSCHSTCSVVKEWSDISGATASTIKTVLTHIKERASFEPSRRDPLRNWWENIMNSVDKEN